MMKKTIIPIFTLFTLLSVCASAQNYSAQTIPDELSRGANAVVRLNSVEYVCKNKTTATEKCNVAVTVLNHGGEDAARIAIYMTTKQGIKSFSGEILGATGNQIRKIKQSDLKISEQSSGLADDMKIYYYEAHVPSFPYTVRYSYEITHKDGIIYFPSFVPVENPDTSVEKASYTLSIPAGTRIHTRNINTDVQPAKTSDGGQDIYTWKTENLKPVVTEPYGRSFVKSMPMVYISPHEFVYNGTEGVMDTWENYAKWQWKLLNNRQKLPQALKDEIASMTAGATSDLEKIRILYDYLAATTRYVSIQLGIGGLQPMTAEQVYNRKFGDCKALSNYMHSMLAECGIPSYYVEIGVSGKDVLPDFVSVLMSNHAILAVPQDDGQMLWLECTAPELPFGFVHSGIAGQNALVYKDGTAYIHKIPAYPDSLHLSSIEGKVTIAADGSMEGGVSRTDALNRYDNRFRFTKMDTRERVNYLQQEINLPLAEISDLVFTQQKTEMPSCTVNYKITKKSNSKDTSGRLFVESSPFRKSPIENQGRSKRKTDIVIGKGFRNLDNITFELDEGFAIESLPPPLSIENKFGKFMQIALPVDGNVLVTRMLQLNTGTYPVSEYEDFKRFIDAVQAGYTAKIVLKRN